MKTLGRITKAYGFEGAVVVRSEGGITREPEQGEPVFIVIDGIPVPFFTREAFSPSPDTLIISFDDYLTVESVDSLRGCEVMSTKEEGRDETSDNLKGYTLVDNNSGFRGKISGVIQNPGQLVASVATKTGEILVPIHPDLIVSVDKAGKVIEMTLPEGLAGIND